MTFEQQKAIQKQVTAYFKDVDDKTFIAIVDAFVYHEPPSASSKVGKIIDKFLIDNGIQNAYVNYVSDVRDEKKMFYRSSMSDRVMIENINMAMLNESFHRFSTTTSIKAKYATLKSQMKSLDDSIKKVMDGGSTDVYHEGLDELRDYYIAKRR